MTIPRVLKATIAVVMFGSVVSAQAPSLLMKPLNDELPNPYRSLRDWAELPNGMTWPAITGILEDSGGRLYMLGRCHKNSCAGRASLSI
jgi:hypothetical protein